MNNSRKLTRWESIRTSWDEFYRSLKNSCKQGGQLLYEIRWVLLVVLIIYVSYVLWNQPTPLSTVKTTLYSGQIAELPYRGVTIHDASGRQLYPTGVN